MRGTRVEIRPAALAHNARLAADWAGDAAVFAMVKAAGYGHGLLVAAQALSPHVQGLGVALLAEAESLREAGIDSPIMVAEGPFDADELVRARNNKLQLVVHSPWQVDLLLADPEPVTLWLKLNTGMNRLGMGPEEAVEQVQRLQTAGLTVSGVMTHFACADHEADDFTAHQWSQAQALAAQLDLPLSAANSAALIRYPDTHGRRVRPGIMLYGGSPFSWRSAADIGLRVSHRFSARLIAINAIEPGESVGYGATWNAEKASRIGVVAVGYGDGYPRHAPNGTPVAVNGQRTRLVGRVSMDMLTVDLTDLNAVVGDEVELWGDTVDVDQVAAACGTISYELFCQITGRPERVIV